MVGTCIRPLSPSPWPEYEAKDWYTYQVCQMVGDLYHSKLSTNLLLFFLNIHLSLFYGDGLGSFPNRSFLIFHQILGIAPPQLVLDSIILLQKVVSLLFQLLMFILSYFDVVFPLMVILIGGSWCFLIDGVVVMILCFLVSGCFGISVFFSGLFVTSSNFHNFWIVRICLCVICSFLFSS